MARVRTELSRVGLPMEELYARTDKFRRGIIDAAIEQDGITVRELAMKFRTTMEHARNHTDTLVTMGCLEKHRGGYEIVLKATGKPYEPTRKVQKKVSAAVKMAEQQLPHGRIIKLLDRRPHEVSKQEHEANRRRSSRSVFTGSTMGMFDGY